jgi:hypothetical protein
MSSIFYEDYLPFINLRFGGNTTSAAKGTSHFALVGAICGGEQ